MSAPFEGIRSHRPSDLGRDLTARECEALVPIVEGKSNVEMADTVGISLSTPSLHVSTIIDKLGAAYRSQAATRAVKHGLVS